MLAAFAEEIFWAGILSVAKGQWEAARSTGLSFFQTLRLVVLPQALRLTIPPLTNRTIAITKNTALASVVAVQEVLRPGRRRAGLLGEHHAAHDGGRGLRAHVPAARRLQPLDRDPLRVAPLAMQLFLDSFFNLAVLQATWPFLWRGFLMTLQLCIVVVPLGVARRRAPRRAVQLPRSAG